MVYVTTRTREKHKEPAPEFEQVIIHRNGWVECMGGPYPTMFYSPEEVKAVVDDGPGVVEFKGHQ